MDISIKLIGHTRIYEIENIVRETFKNVNLDFSDNFENKVISEYCDDTVYTTMIINGETFRGEFSFNPEKPYLNKLGLIINLSYADCYNKYSVFSLPWGILIGIRPQKKASMLKEMGYDDSQVKEILIYDFLIHEDKADLILAANAYEEKALGNLIKNGVSVYVGIPFCPTRCAYCSFISKTYKDSSIIDKYVECLKKEMEALKELENIETVYIGGGTPTTLNENQLEDLLSFMHQNFNFNSLKEFTVEAGRPDTVTEEKLKILYDNRVDRISINPQTLNDRTLKLIGRNHSAYEFFKAYEIAQKFNFKTVNTDLIAGLKNESLEDFKYTIDKIIALKPENITVHTLSIKRAAELTFEDDKKNIANEMQKYSLKALSDYKPYYLYRQKNTLDNLENVGYTKPGHECLYNMYMMNEIQSIISFGGGSVTKLVSENGVERIRNPKDADLYIKEIENVINCKKTQLNM